MIAFLQEQKLLTAKDAKNSQSSQSESLCVLRASWACVTVKGTSGSLNSNCECQGEAATACDNRGSSAGWFHFRAVLHILRLRRASGSELAPGSRSSSDESGKTPPGPDRARVRSCCGAINASSIPR